ncbi:hypothetical protein [Fodinicola feengrottensis]|uniref:hypothetical protein n=1 Tax=Fodinicola feengrottensis TaxID=435914 RepID=UPI0024417739|nr:hypothetical protein [Fodinicola feengrottensis]
MLTTSTLTLVAAATFADAAPVAGTALTETGRDPTDPVAVPLAAGAFTEVPLAGAPTLIVAMAGDGHAEVLGVFKS